MRKQLFWVLGAACLLMLSGIGVPGVSGAEPQSNFTNIQVLTDMSDGDIQRLMQSWARQLGGVSCIECHVQGDFASDELPAKVAARNMARMVMSLNENFFQSPEFESIGREAECFMCHQGSLEIPQAD
jgi:hypothetical protein